MDHKKGTYSRQNSIKKKVSSVTDIRGLRQMARKNNKDGSLSPSGTDRQVVIIFDVLSNNILISLKGLNT